VVKTVRKTRSKKKATARRDTDGAVSQEYKYKVRVEYLDKKLNKLPPEALRAILKIMLVELLMLEDIGLQFQAVGREQADHFLDNNIKWLATFDFALEKLFAWQPRAIGEEEARRNLRVLVSLLQDLREGSPSIYSANLSRARGDRRDNRRQKELKDQAARAYRFLTSLGAAASEATEVINHTIQRHCELFGLPKFPLLEPANLRKRGATVGDLPEATRKDTLEMLGRPGPPFTGKLPNDNSRERGVLIRATCVHLLSGYIRETAHVGAK
jgi:hypothetical protein